MAARHVSLVVLLLVGCGLKHGDDEIAETRSSMIVGTNDLVAVALDGSNVPARYRPLLDAFGRSTNLCTVTHVGNGIVLTAGHCFLPHGQHVENAPCDVAILWGFRDEDALETTTSECVVVHEARYDETADWAILRVAPIPKVYVKPSLGKRARVGTELTAFGHPNLRPLEWSKRCTLASSDAAHFAHDCDTEPGSSGSSLLDNTTLEVVGIHGGGSPSGWNYATHLADTSLAKLVGF